MKYAILLSFAFMFLAGASTATEVNRAELLSLEASAKLAKRDYQGAEAIYTRVIAMQSDDPTPYVQRAMTRRAMGNEAGVQTDARKALDLANIALQKAPNDGDLYYQRSLANRLLKSFDAAIQDLDSATRHGRHVNRDVELKAIELERKMAQ